MKAECDICCTSSNAVKVVESLGAPRVLLIPDEYLAKYVQTKTKVEIIAWKGHCEVHERFTAEDIAAMRAADPGIEDHRAPRVPAGGHRGLRLHRLDGGDDQLRNEQSARARWC